ncbi:Rieske (2Fe-2S) protein [Micromonospora sp. WMMD987]|jgi:Rieske Fe-S protein|uniref:Rieske (2Fe-2S) protein n=1 Tax=Micromonospora TaxID=1873 RepID=UPI002499B641|nr:Rieske (2Fe-2S) protein [Micromonospora sp. WMMD987]WFE93869.1 Rieske (2Fe-2S) protein [Micromonospora sp. WMMD987]
MNDDQALTGVGKQTRRALLAGAGAVGASVLLTACGDDSGDEPTSTASSGAPAASNAGGGPGTVVAKTADIPVGGGQVYAAQGVVITQPTAGQFKAFDPICTHQGCPVSNVDGGTINCTCHNSTFAITDGAAKSGPATTPLAAKQIKVEGDQIVLA